jgi:hypothetical protein
MIIEILVQLNNHMNPNATKAQINQSLQKESIKHSFGPTTINYSGEILAPVFISSNITDKVISVLNTIPGVTGVSNVHKNGFERVLDDLKEDLK